MNRNALQHYKITPEEGLNIQLIVTPEQNKDALQRNLSYITRAPQKRQSNPPILKSKVPQTDIGEMEKEGFVVKNNTVGEGQTNSNGHLTLRNNPTTNPKYPNVTKPNIKVRYSKPVNQNGFPRKQLSSDKGAEMKSCKTKAVDIQNLTRPPEEARSSTSASRPNNDQKHRDPSTSLYRSSEKPVSQNIKHRSKLMPSKNVTIRQPPFYSGRSIYKPPCRYSSSLVNATRNAPIEISKPLNVTKSNMKIRHSTFGNNYEFPRNLPGSNQATKTQNLKIKTANVHIQNSARSPAKSLNDTSVSKLTEVQQNRPDRRISFYRESEKPVDQDIKHESTTISSTNIDIPPTPFDNENIYKPPCHYSSSPASTTDTSSSSHPRSFSFAMPSPLKCLSRFEEPFPKEAIRKLQEKINTSPQRRLSLESRKTPSPNTSLQSEHKTHIEPVTLDRRSSLNFNFPLPLAQPFDIDTVDIPIPTFSTVLREKIRILHEKTRRPTPTVSSEQNTKEMPPNCELGEGKYRTHLLQYDSDSGSYVSSRDVSKFTDDATITDDYIGPDESEMQRAYVLRKSKKSEFDPSIQRPKTKGWALDTQNSLSRQLEPHTTDSNGDISSVSGSKTTVETDFEFKGKEERFRRKIKSRTDTSMSEAGISSSLTLGKYPIPTLELAYKAEKERLNILDQALKSTLALEVEKAQREAQKASDHAQNLEIQSIRLKNANINTISNNNNSEVLVQLARCQAEQLKATAEVTKWVSELRKSSIEQDAFQKQQQPINMAAIVFAAVEEAKKVSQERELLLAQQRSPQQVRIYQKMVVRDQVSQFPTDSSNSEISPHIVNKMKMKATEKGTHLIESQVRRLHDEQKQKLLSNQLRMGNDQSETSMSSIQADPSYSTDFEIESPSISENLLFETSGVAETSSSQKLPIVEQDYDRLPQGKIKSEKQACFEDEPIYSSSFTTVVDDAISKEIATNIEEEIENETEDKVTECEEDKRFEDDLVPSSFTMAEDELLTILEEEEIQDGVDKQISVRKITEVDEQEFVDGPVSSSSSRVAQDELLEEEVTQIPEERRIEDDNQLHERKITEGKEQECFGNDLVHSSLLPEVADETINKVVLIIVEEEEGIENMHQEDDQSHEGNFTERIEEECFIDELVTSSSLSAAEDEALNKGVETAIVHSISSEAAENEDFGKEVSKILEDKVDDQLPEEKITEGDKQKGYTTVEDETLSKVDTSFEEEGIEDQNDDKSADSKITEDDKQEYDEDWVVPSNSFTAAEDETFNKGAETIVEEGDTEMEEDELPESKEQECVEDEVVPLSSFTVAKDEVLCKKAENIAEEDDIENGDDNQLPEGEMTEGEGEEQEWFEDEFVPSSLSIAEEDETLRKEAAKIVEEQKRIENEIRVLEALAASEIPDKPPPPYSPPSSSGSSSLSIYSRFFAISFDELRLKDVIEGQIDRIWPTWSASGTFEHYDLDLNKDLPNSSIDGTCIGTAVSENLPLVAAQSFDALVFDTVRKIIPEVLQIDSVIDKSFDDQIRGGRLAVEAQRLRIPKSKESLCETVLQQFMEVIPPELAADCTNLPVNNVRRVTKWTSRPRDMVDEILIEELVEEDKEWTECWPEEILVINQLQDRTMKRAIREVFESFRTVFG